MAMFTLVVLSCWFGVVAVYGGKIELNTAYGYAEKVGDGIYYSASLAYPAKLVRRVKLTTLRPSGPTRTFLFKPEISPRELVPHLHSVWEDGKEKMKLSVVPYLPRSKIDLTMQFLDSIRESVIRNDNFKGFPDKSFVVDVPYPNSDTIYFLEDKLHDHFFVSPLIKEYQLQSLDLCVQHNHYKFSDYRGFEESPPPEYGVVFGGDFKYEHEFGHDSDVKEEPQQLFLVEKEELYELAPYGDLFPDSQKKFPRLFLKLPAVGLSTATNIDILGERLKLKEGDKTVLAYGKPKQPSSRASSRQPTTSKSSTERRQTRRVKKL